MANTIYTKAKQNLLDGNIDLNNGTIKVLLVNVTGAGTLYTPDFNLDDALADIPAGARIGSGATLANKSITDGVFDADDTVITAPPAGTACEALVLYVDSGVESTSYLIAYIDTGTGLPITTNGADVTVKWDNGSNKILRIT